MGIIGNVISKIGQVLGINPKESGAEKAKGADAETSGLEFKEQEKADTCSFSKIKERAMEQKEKRNEIEKKRAEIYKQTQALTRQLEESSINQFKGLR